MQIRAVGVLSDLVVGIIEDLIDVVEAFRVDIQGQICERDQERDCILHRQMLPLHKVLRLVQRRPRTAVYSVGFLLLRRGLGLVPFTAVAAVSAIEGVGSLSPFSAFAIVVDSLSGTSPMASAASGCSEVVECGISFCQIDLLQQSARACSSSLPLSSFLLPRLSVGIVSIGGP